MAHTAQSSNGGFGPWGSETDRFPRDRPGSPSRTTHQPPPSSITTTRKTAQPRRTSPLPFCKSAAHLRPAAACKSDAFVACTAAARHAPRFANSYPTPPRPNHAKVAPSVFQIRCVPAAVPALQIRHPPLLGFPRLRAVQVPRLIRHDILSHMDHATKEAFAALTQTAEHGFAPPSRKISPTSVLAWRPRTILKTWRPKTI